MNLVKFAKTTTLKQGTSQDITFTIRPYDLACYDDYNKNANGHAGYELDRGKYTLSLRANAHTLIYCENNQLNYQVASTINIDKDPDTGATVENRFTGESAYLGMPIDGSTAGGTPIKYLSRSDFKGTFPFNRTLDRSDKAAIKAVNEKRNDRYDVDTTPTTDQKNNLYMVTKSDGSKASEADLSGTTGVELQYNEKLIADIGGDYDSVTWNSLLDQLSVADMKKLVGNGFFGTKAIESVGSPQTAAYDGPAGFNKNDAPADVKAKFVAFPSESLTGCSWNTEIAYNMGQAQGVIAGNKINGWYGPGLNLHRNPFSGRWFEYYSEDSILVGNMAAEVIRGATNNGLTCYMKHFAVSEEGINPDNVKTWITEQALRETYLKPFEIAVKEGGANAIMTAFNCIGAVWCAACDPLNNDILRGEWQFRGSLLTDWALGYRDWMDGMRGIRGGNDLWLDSNEPFDSDPTTVTLLRNASKNILYTYANTYVRASNYAASGGQDDKYKVELKIDVMQSPFSPLPIIMVVALWLLTSIGVAVCLVFIFKKDGKAKVVNVNKE